VAGSVGLGALVGGAILSPGLGLAQTSGATGSTGSSGSAIDDHAGWCFGDGDGPIATAADAIGIPPGDLLYAMRDGSTIAEVAKAEGVEVQTVVDALVASMQDRLDQAVADGYLSREVADEISADLEQRATDIVNGQLPFMHGGPMMGHGPWGGMPGTSDDAGASTANVGLF